MFDIGFSELVMVFIVGLVVLGPRRMPIAIRTVMQWVRTIRGLAANVQNELAQELKLQELQESIKKAESLKLDQLSPELAQTVEDLKQSAQKMKADLDKQASEANQSLQEHIKQVREANFQAGQAVTQEISPETAVQKTDENHTALEANQQSESAPTIEDEMDLDEKLAQYIDQYHPDDPISVQSKPEKTG